MNDHLYHYRAHVESVYDGDTCTLNIDLGLGIWVHGEKVRLSRINAPEVRGKERPEGLRARDWLRERIDGHDVRVTTLKDKKGKYGRYIVELWIEDAPGVFTNISDDLVNSGHAVYKSY